VKNTVWRPNSLQLVYLFLQWHYRSMWPMAFHSRDLNFCNRSFTFNSNKSPTWCNHFSVYYSDVCLQLNMFWACSRPSAGAQWLQWQPLVLPSYRGDSRAVGRGRAGPTTTNSKHVQLHSKNTFEKLVHLVGFIIRIETYFNGFGWVFSTSIS